MGRNDAMPDGCCEHCYRNGQTVARALLLRALEQALQGEPVTLPSGDGWRKALVRVTQLAASRGSRGRK